MFGVLLAISLQVSAHERSPAAVALDPESKLLYIACATVDSVLAIDPLSGVIAKEIPVPQPPSGLTISRGKLYVTCAAPVSSLLIIDLSTSTVIGKIASGHTAMAPVLHPNGTRLYVCNRFENSVSMIDLAGAREAKRVPVSREPVGAAITPDGKFLLIANHLHNGRANATEVAASVSVVDTAAETVAREISFPNGSGLLRGICVSPDGKHAAVTHLLSRFNVPTTQIERGWINNNALTIIEISRLEPLNTVLLDEIDRGAANPWACAWSDDGRFIVVTHAGTHEISLIDAPGLLAKLHNMPLEIQHNEMTDYTMASRVAADVPNDLSFLVGLRRRIALPQSDRGPRALTLFGGRAYVASYFSDTLNVIDLTSYQSRSISLERASDLASHHRPSLARMGEFYFNDASICFQGWQSCASCHSSDGRVDGLNWDNLNDGIGNPKNVKSLLLAHETPPSMWLGVRSNAAVAVRAGIKNSLFTIQPHEVGNALDAYLQSLQKIPSPHLRDGKLTPAAKRGEKLFSGAAGCADCHPKPLYTDLKQHKVGTRSAYDQPGDKFDTPTLTEVWRTAPYLHDGSATTVGEVLTGKHGNVAQLAPEELSNLIEFVLSL